MPLVPMIHKIILIPFLVFVSSFYLFTDSKEQVFYVMFGLLLVYFLATQARDLFRPGYFVWGLLLLLLYYSASTLWSSDPGGYFEKSLKHSVYILIFYLCLTQLLRRCAFASVVRWTLVVMLISGVLVSLLSLLLQWGSYDFSNRFTHSSLLGLTDNPIETGFFLGMASLAAIFFFRQETDTKRAGLLLGAAALMLCLLVITRSRGANLFFIVSLVLLVLSARPVIKSRDSTLFIAAVTGGVIATVLIGDKVIDRVTSPNYRLDLVLAAWDVAKEHLAFGAGWNPEDRLAIPSIDKLFSKPHNTFMQSLQVGGLAGLTLFLSLTAYVIYRGITDKTDITYVRFLLIWFIYGCLMIAIDGGMFVTRPSTFWLYYWVPAFLIVAKPVLTETK